MKIITDVISLQNELAQHKHERIALVPTMGCLHEGHASLIQKAKRLADVVVVSIYVNPLQFGANEDLSRYPRPFANDAAVCEAQGADYIFHPHHLYPADGMQVGLHVNSLSNVLCGAARPGHFDGVVTVVNILFNIVQPAIAVFGAKDFQQLTIIRRMVADLFIPVMIVEAETIREPDGLAKSSRNQYLDPSQRQQAAHIAQALRLMQDVAPLHHVAAEVIDIGLNHLHLHHISPEYLLICDHHDLQPVSELTHKQHLRIFVAAPIGAARLIDNMPLLQSNDKETLSCK